MAGKFKSRSTELELMDHPIEDHQEIFKNFKELVFINKYLGGSSHSFDAIKALSQGRERLHVADIGFGAGDFLQYLLKRREKLTKSLELTGVDFMPEAKMFARQHFPAVGQEVQLVQDDYRDWLKKGARPDIIHASLFCHHLTDDQLVEFFRLALDHARVGVVINDLQRHPAAYYAIKILCRLFSNSRFTKNDAPLSVLRGFKQKELEQLLWQAGINSFKIEWKWAFRHVITMKRLDTHG